MSLVIRAIDGMGSGGQFPFRALDDILRRHRHIDNETLFRHLTENGVMCAQRGGGIRFSPHYYAPPEKILQAVTLSEDCRLG